MLDRLERRDHIPALVVTQVVHSTDGDVHAGVLPCPSRRGAGQLESADVPARVAGRLQGETRPGAQLEQPSGWARIAPKEGELAPEVRTVDRRVGEVVAVSDAAIAGQLEIVRGAVDGLELLGGWDRIAAREAAGKTDDDPPPMRVHDAIRATAAEWTGMRELS